MKGNTFIHMITSGFGVPLATVLFKTGFSFNIIFILVSCRSLSLNNQSVMLFDNLNNNKFTPVLFRCIAICVPIKKNLLNLTVLLNQHK